VLKGSDRELVHRKGQVRGGSCTLIFMRGVSVEVHNVFLFVTYKSFQNKRSLWIQC
jgi:hypothetical protein